MGKEVIGKLFKNVIQGAFSSSQQRKAEKKQAKQLSAGRANVMVNKQSNNDPIYPMYGQQRMGGTRVFVEASNGSGSVQSTVPDATPEDPEKTKVINTEYLNMVIAICEGNINDMTQLWFNDTIVWQGSITDSNKATVLSSGGYELKGFETGTQFSGAGMYIAWYPGRGDQTVDTTIQTSVGSSVWGSNHKLQSVSYLAFKLQASEKFGGQLPTMNATLKGKQIIDVSQLTDGDTAPLPTSAYTWGADQNPADVMYDYLIHPFYGKGLDRLGNGTWVAGTNINIASFQQAKIDCNAARGGSGYPLNGFLQTEKQIFDNISEILEVCNGMLLFVNGKYELRIRKKDEQLTIPSSAIFTRDNILGEVSLGLPSKSAKLNKVTGLFNNAAEKWNDDLVLFQSGAFQTEDNGTVLETQEDYTLITNGPFVEDLITQMAEQSRDLYQLSFVAAHTALLLASGDVIEVRLDDLGWGTGVGQTRKYFRVQELKLTEDNTVEITATTYNSALEL
jgi:hypothetical protein